MEIKKKMKDLYAKAEKIYHNGVDGWKEYGKKAILSTLLVATVANAGLPTAQAMANEYDHTQSQAIETTFESKYDAHDLKFKLLEKDLSDKDATRIFVDTLTERLQETAPDSDLLKSLKKDEVNIELVDGLLEDRKLIAAFLPDSKSIVVDKNTAMTLPAAEVFNYPYVYKADKNAVESMLKRSYDVPAYDSVEDVREFVEETMGHDVTRLLEHENHHKIIMEKLQKLVDSKYGKTDAPVTFNDFDTKSAIMVEMGLEISAHLFGGKSEFEKGGDAWDTFKSFLIPETGTAIDNYAAEHGIKPGETIPSEHIKAIDKMLYDSFMNDTIASAFGSMSSVNIYKHNSVVNMMHGAGSGDFELTYEEFGKVFGLDHVLKGEKELYKDIFLSKDQAKDLGVPGVFMDKVPTYDPDTNKVSGGMHNNKPQSSTVDVAALAVHKAGATK